VVPLVHRDLKPENVLLAKDLSPFFSSVVANLLAKSPSERVRSAAALHRTLLEAEKSAWWEERREDAEWRAERGVKIPVRRGTRVYGRDREREALGEAWERARGGAGAMVLLEGEAGIGKTRLVDVFAQGAAREGATVLYGSFGAGHALVDAVAEHFGERLEAELEWLLQDTPALLPAFVALLRHEPPPRRARRSRAARATRCGAGSCARSRGTGRSSGSRRTSSSPDRKTGASSAPCSARRRAIACCSSRRRARPFRPASLRSSRGRTASIASRCAASTARRSSACSTTRSATRSSR